MDNHIKQAEIAHARSSGISSSTIGNFHHQLVGEYINELLKVNDNTVKLLEVGCGKGDLRKYINCQYFGIDPIELPECCEFQFTKCSGQKTQFLSNYFDLVIIKDGINYYSDLEELFSELFRILKKDGLIVITEFVGNSYSLPRFALKKFIKFRLGLMRNYWDNTYLGYYSHVDIVKHVGKYLKDVKYSYNQVDERYFISAKENNLYN